MTIKVYDSIMNVEPKEVYDDYGVSVEEWVKSKTSNYQRGNVQPIACTINGKVIKPEDWPGTFIGKNDNAEFRVIPYGDALNVVFPFWAGTINVGIEAGFQYLLPDVPGQPGAGQQGAQLEPARARANTARLGQAVPEIFGEYIRYPDYLCQPRRYYKDTKTQALDLTLAIGVGEYQIDTSLIKIGDTPVSDLGQTVTYAIHQPGDTLPAAYKNWYNSPEVGASTSSAGIRLQGINQSALLYEDAACSAVTDTLSNIEPDPLWEAGFQLEFVEIYQPVSISDDATADIITGEFQHLNVGGTVSISDSSGSFNGESPYIRRVRSIGASNTELTLEDFSGTPVTDLPTGSFDLSFRPNIIYFIDSIGASSITFAAETSGGTPYSPSLPSVPSASCLLDFDIDDFDLLWAGPFRAIPSGETGQDFEVDLFAPQGLGVIDGADINSRSRDIEIQYRLNGGAWISVTKTLSGATRDQLGWTFLIEPLVSASNIEVRIRRLDAEDTSTTSLDRIEWIGMRAELPRANSYPEVTTMTMTIEGSDTVASSSENRINLVPKRKLPEISSGTFTANTTTRKISAAACYVAKSLGYDDSQLDLNEFERLETTWTSRGDYFDFVFSDTTAKAAIESILRAGFAEMTLETGMIKPVRDEPRTTFEQGYSPENMTAALRREFQAKQVDEPDGVEVEYVDGNTWTTETVNAFLPGDIGIKVDKIRLDGVTDETRAWRIGMRRRRAQKYRRWTYSFGTELDALNSQYLSYVPLLDDIPNYGYGKVSILLSISSDRIVVSEPLEWIDGETHVVAYRDENGNTVGPFTATQGPDDYTALVTIPEPWPKVNPSSQEPTHIYFGTTSRWNFPALITEIRPNGPLETSVTATNYDARVYGDDDNAPT